MATWQSNRANNPLPVKVGGSGSKDLQPAASQQEEQELSVEEYRALLTRPMTNLELLFSFPKMGEDFEFGRDPDCGREIDLGG